MLCHCMLIMTFPYFTSKICQHILVNCAVALLEKIFMSEEIFGLKT